MRTLFLDVLLHLCAVTSIWGLLALRLADEAVLPFDYLAYAKELQVRSHSNKLISGAMRFMIYGSPEHPVMEMFLVFARAAW